MGLKNWKQFSKTDFQFKCSQSESQLKTLEIKSLKDRKKKIVEICVQCVQQMDKTFISV